MSLPTFNFDRPRPLPTGTRAIRLGVTIYRSGLSNCPSDLEGFARAGAAVGISLHRLTRPVRLRAIAYAQAGGRVFVDSGAFSGRIAPDVVLDQYAALVGEAGAGAVNLALVAPDVVGDQHRTLTMQQDHAPTLRTLMSSGATVILPVQRGLLLPEEVVGRLQALFGNDITVGIPYCKAAFTEGDVVALVQATGLRSVHLLGGGEKKANSLAARLPPMQLTGDSCRVRSLSLQCDERDIEAQAENLMDSTPDLDPTEFMMLLREGAPITARELTELADAAMMDVGLVRAALRRGDIDELGENLAIYDAGWPTILGIVQRRAERLARVRMRTAAIAQSEAVSTLLPLF